MLTTHVYYELNGYTSVGVYSITHAYYTVQYAYYTPRDYTCRHAYLPCLVVIYPYGFPQMSHYRRISPGAMQESHNYTGFQQKMVQKARILISGIDYVNLYT